MVPFRLSALLMLALLTLGSPALAVEVPLCLGALKPSVKGDCGGVGYEGCCDLLGRNLYCKKGDLYCVDCADGFQFCGWNKNGYYDCGQKEGSQDPLGKFPLSCGGGCSPLCHPGSPCSADCPGDCGSCADGAFCLPEGQCYAPQCQDKECGKDPKGFLCGTCKYGTACIEALGKCLPLPKPCLGKQGPGCGGCDCEGCVCSTYPECCEENWDIFCAAACELECDFDCSPCPADPSCAGLECGDYCGVSCGKCAVGEVCYQYHCCTPDCEGKSCGLDGCGGLCGQCTGKDKCVGGQCLPCVPQCAGKACGADGCGGGCGECAGGTKCIENQCLATTCQGSCGGQSQFGCFCDDACDQYGDCCPDVCIVCPEICELDPCQGIGPKGCCDGETLKWCVDNTLQTQDCAQVGPMCGWNGPASKYDCKTAGGDSGDPLLPIECASLCKPLCLGKECGPDGCGGQCGQCAGKNVVCTADGHCCQTSCSGKQCGPDGCGGQCGQCAQGLYCTGKSCSDKRDPGCFAIGAAGCDGCGCQECVATLDAFCVEVSWDEQCAAMCGEQCGADCPCLPRCAGKECGEDGCGGNCGECPENFYCTPAGFCSDECIADCSGKSCGDDGCGGSCGSCRAGDYCTGDFRCLPDCNGIPWEGCCDGETLKYCQDEALVTKSCAGNPSCGWKGTFYDCGTGGSGDPAELFPLSCAGYCAPKCKGKECGDDGCGGSCGQCPADHACVKGACIESDCGPLGFEGCCAANNVLWWCEQGKLKKLNCRGKGACGWNPVDGFYNCGTSGTAEPTGAIPFDCPDFICVPDCAGKQCGEDGCGGLCGLCKAPTQCADGLCVGPAPEPDPVDLKAGGEEIDEEKPTPPPPAGNDGGCSAGPGGAGGSPSTALPALLALLALPWLVMRRRPAAGRGWVLLVALALLPGCSGGGGGDASGGELAAPDTVAPVDLAAEAAPAEVAPVDAAGELTDLATVTDGPLKEMPPEEIVEIIPDEVEQPFFDCSQIPSGPLKMQKVKGVIASEDLAFDGKGYLTGSNNKSIFKSDPEGNHILFSPDLEFRAGLAYLPNGWLIVNDNNLGRLVKIDPDGVQYTLLEGLKYPNGITVDMKGWVYVTEHDAPRVLRVHPYTGEYTVLTTEISNPNGIAFTPDYTGLYIGSFGSGWVYYLSISEEGEPGRLEEWGTLTESGGGGLLDGIAVDYCGNVYVCEYGATEIWRFPPSGKHPIKLVDATDLGTYLPNLRFGAGPGWDSWSLYSPDGWKPEDGVWRIPIGVPPPPLPYP